MSTLQEYCKCGEAAFRHCRTCSAYFCSGCLCVHLSEEVTAVEPDEKGSPLAGMETSDTEVVPQAPTSGVNWLSNATIVGGMSDDRIKRAIQHYRTLIAVLQSELVARELGHGRGSGGKNLLHRRGPKLSVDGKNQGNKARGRRGDKGLDKAITQLNTEALLKLIKILEKKTNADAKSS